MSNTGIGIRGIMPLPIVNHENNAAFASSRFILRNARNGNEYNRRGKRILTPFRAVMNAGDVLSRSNYACGGGSSQSPQSRPSVHGLGHRIGGGQSMCMPSVLYGAQQVDLAVPAGTCNGRFVYDSSDYITYLKRRSINGNYNDRSFG